MVDKSIAIEISLFALFFASVAFSAPLITCNKGAMQFVGNDGKIINVAKYKRLFHLANGCFWATTNDFDMFSAQMLSPEGRQITGPKYCLYDDVAICTIPFPFPCGAIIAQRKKAGTSFQESELIYPDGKTVSLGLSQDQAFSFGNFTSMSLDNGKNCLYDVANRKRRLGIDGDALLFSGTAAVIVRDGNGIYLIKTAGDVVRHGPFDDVILCLESDDAIWVEKDGKRLLYDVRNDKVIALEADTGWKPVPNGSIGRNVKIRSGGKWGVYSIDRSEYVIQPKYDDFYWATTNAIVGLSGGISELVSLRDGNVLFATSGKISRKLPTTSNGCELWEIAEKGRSVVSVLLSGNAFWNLKGITVRGVLRFGHNPPQCELLFWVVKDSVNGLVGALSADGRTMLFPMTPESSVKLSQWASKVLVSDSTTALSAVINLSGSTLLPFSRGVSTIDSLDESGYARILCNGKAGMVNGDCDFVLPCEYEDVGHFSEGLVPVKKDGKWGFVTLDGEWVISARFEMARSFKGGYAPVRVRGKWGFISKSGKEATPFAYEDVADIRGGYFRARVGEKWGIFAEDGRCSLRPIYDAILAEGELGYNE